jgi:hypothetical protein
MEAAELQKKREDKSKELREKRAKKEQKSRKWA